MNNLLTKSGLSSNEILLQKSVGYEVCNTLSKTLFELQANMYFYMYQNSDFKDFILNNNICSFEEFMSYLENNEDEEALDIYTFIQENPFITIAGGAPRDWEILGKPAKDLDVYIGVNKFCRKFLKQSSKSQEDVVNHDVFLKIFQDAFGSDNIIDKSKDTEMFTSYVGVHTNILRVFGLKYKEVDFDLILIDISGANEDAFKSSLVKGKKSFEECVVDTFDFNICKCYVKVFDSFKVVITDEAQKDVENKTFTLEIKEDIYNNMTKHNSKLYSSCFKHYPKLKYKFEGFEFNPKIIK